VETPREEFESVFLCMMHGPGLFEIKSKNHIVRLQKMKAVVVRSRFQKDEAGVDNLAYSM
jgi:hypothetical protein